MIDLDDNQRKALKISLTPLIDIVFILLVFFMLVTSFLKWNSITLSSHQPIDELQIDKEGTLLIINSPGNYEINSKALTLDQAKDLLRNKLKSDANHSLLIQTKDNVPLQELVDVMTYMKNLMGNNISLTKYESSL
ncbi:MAG: biopolymer transporter ExbD [Pseudomonadota bacterium]